MSLHNTINLHPFQSEVVEKFFSAQTKGRLLAGIPVGGGKTVVATTIILRLLDQLHITPTTNKTERSIKQKFVALCITPANLRFNIGETFHKFGVDDSLVQTMIVTSVKQLDGIFSDTNTSPATIAVISYNFAYMNCSSLARYRWSIVICDEVHYGKNMDSRTASCLLPLSMHSDKFLGLTASFVHNKLEEFLTIMAIVIGNPTLVKTMSKYIKYEYVGRYDPNWFERIFLRRKKVKGNLTQTGFTNDEYVYSVLNPHIYIPKSEKMLLVGNLPTVKHHTIETRLSTGDSRIYLAIQKQIPSWLLKVLKRGDPSDAQLRTIKNEIMALQQVLITPDYMFVTQQKDYTKKVTNKVMKCAEILKTQAKTICPAIVYTAFVEHGAVPVHTYFKSVGLRSALYTGQLDPNERSQIRQQFQSGQLDVLVLTQAGKEGINLPAAQSVHFLNLAWNPETLVQVMGRALRIDSQNELVHIFWHKSRLSNGDETIDFWMDTILTRKRLLKMVLVDIFHESIVYPYAS